MKAIVVSIGDLAVRLAETLMDNSKKPFSVGEKTTKALVRVSTYYVSARGEEESRELLEALYQIEGREPFKGTSYELELEPGVYKVTIIPQKEGFVYPVVEDEIRIESDDVEVDAVAEVYQQYKVEPKKERRGPLTLMILGLLLGLMAGLLKIVGIYGLNSLIIYMKYAVGGISSGTFFYLLKGRKGEREPEEEDVRSLTVTYLGFLLGMGAALLVDFLAISGLISELAGLLYPLGNLEEELIMLFSGSLGTLLGLLLWLLRELPAMERGITYIQQDWITEKRKAILYLALLMFTGGLVGSLFSTFSLGTVDLTMLATFLVISAITLLASIMVGLISELLSRDRKWELSAPLLATAGTFSLVKGLLDYIALITPFLGLGLPILPIHVVVGQILGYSSAGIYALSYMLRNVVKLEGPCLCVDKVKSKAIKGPRKFKSEIFGMALSQNRNTLLLARNIAALESSINREFRRGVELRIHVDDSPHNNCNSIWRKVREGVNSLLSYVSWKCGYPPDVALLLIDLNDESSLITACRERILDALSESLPDIPLISLIIYSSNLLTSRDNVDIAQSLKKIEDESYTVFMADLDEIVTTGELSEESIKNVLEKLSASVGALLDIDEQRGTLRISPRKVSQLLTKPDQDPFALLAISSLNKDNCLNGVVNSDHVRGLVRAALSKPLARANYERGWSIIILRGPEDCMYVWAAREELSKKVRVVGISDEIVEGEPLTIVIMVSGLLLEDFEPFSRAEEGEEGEV